MKVTRNEREMTHALTAVLLFHSGEWDETKDVLWQVLTGTSEPTPKNLCNTVRAVLPNTSFFTSL